MNIDWSKFYDEAVRGGSDKVTIGRPDMNLNPSDIVSRILSPPHRFVIKSYVEEWGLQHRDILHIALFDTNTKQIVRFEEDPNTFPSDTLVDKLRCLR